jgi:hypothetical protein
VLTRGATPWNPPLRSAPARWYFADSAGPGGDPRNPPLRSAPAPWYFADTPATRRA